jgi:hypothetical protein
VREIQQLRTQRIQNLHHMPLRTVAFAAILAVGASHGFISKPMARNAVVCDALYPPDPWNNDNFQCKTGE